MDKSRIDTLANGRYNARVAPSRNPEFSKLLVEKKMENLGDRIKEISDHDPNHSRNERRAKAKYKTTEEGVEVEIAAKATYDLDFSEEAWDNSELSDMRELAVVIYADDLPIEIEIIDPKALEECSDAEINHTLDRLDESIALIEQYNFTE